MAAAAIALTPHFVVVDSRKKEELEGAVNEYSGNTYEVIGDNTISPSLQSRLVARVDALVRDQGKGKTLEITSTRITTEPDPRGISTRTPSGAMPIGVEIFGRLIWKGIDRATLGRNVVVLVQGTYDGVDFFGHAAGGYRADLSATIDSLAGAAVDAAAESLRTKLAERDAPNQPTAGELKPGT